jgi:hypothetical protein
MEAVTYEKLRAYAPRMPPNILKIWEPPRAVRELLKLEGEADQEYKVAFGRTGSTQPMEVIGEHRTFAMTWLSKHYHKISNIALHVPNGNDPDTEPQVDAQELREYLESVVAECERVVESSITTTLALTVEFNCRLCGRQTVANAESAKRRGRVSCLHPRCEADYVVSTAEDGSLYFRPDGSVFPCQACGYRILVPSKRLVPDHEFACDACGRRHKLVKDWYYAVEVKSSAEV